MDWTEVDSDLCAVTRAMEVLGDRWSVLVLREIFNGVRRFDDIQGHIGVSRSVLSGRLRDLVEYGVLRKTEYQPEGGRVRHEYRLTEMGRSLQVVMQSLMEFGDRWLTDTPGSTLEVRHKACDAQVHVRSVCDEGHVITEPRELYAQLGQPLKAASA